MQLRKLFIFLILSYFNTLHLAAQASKSSEIDVLEYQVFLEPFFSDQSIKGSVSISFQTASRVEQVAFDSGKLIVLELVF